MDKIACFFFLFLNTSEDKKPFSFREAKKNRLLFFPKPVIFLVDCSGKRLLFSSHLLQRLLLLSRVDQTPVFSYWFFPMSLGDLSKSTPYPFSSVTIYLFKCALHLNPRSVIDSHIIQSVNCGTVNFMLSRVQNWNHRIYMH